MILENVSLLPIQRFTIALFHILQISGRALVKARLKLSFTSTTRKKMVATKLFQITQKGPARREYKQLDSVLKTYDTDGKVGLVQNTSILLMLMHGCTLFPLHFNLLSSFSSHVSRKLP
jgi:hypothetical protein